MSARPVTSTADGLRPSPARLARATVAVLMGGRSSERAVSLVSGEGIQRALATPTEAGDERGPARVLGVDVAADGRWVFAGRPLAVGEALAELAQVDLCFLALHGGEGENGAIQGLLTCADVPFTGSGVVASALAMDKVFSRVVVAAAGLRVARGESVTRAARGEPCGSTLLDLARAGCVVKPRRGGSSVGCTLVLRPDELERALTVAFEHGGDVLVEELVRGTEASVAVLESPAGELVVPPPVEIRPRHAFFDYHDKYSADGALELCPPRTLSPRAVDALCQDAAAAHRALGCAGYSRTDFIVPEDGGRPVFLETNTLPGMTPRSLVPQAAMALGIDYRTLCLWIAERGLAGGRSRGEG
jgi:D-alanine-D-alanine ligase